MKINSDVNGKKIQREVIEIVSFGQLKKTSKFMLFHSKINYFKNLSNPFKLQSILIEIKNSQHSWRALTLSPTLNNSTGIDHF